MRIHNYNTRDCALPCALGVCNMLKHNALSVPFRVPFVCPKSMQHTENQYICCALAKLAIVKFCEIITKQFTKQYIFCK